MTNLFFKFSWDHRPFPYNTGQGKRQFTLPFASGIPNLTPDISQVQGVGTAAKANLGAEGNNVPVAKDAFKAAHFNPVDVYWSGTGANPPHLHLQILMKCLLVPEYYFPEPLVI